MPDKIIRILYVDDNPHDRALVRDALEREDSGFDVTEAVNRGGFVERLAGGGFDCVLSDFNILGFTGLEVLDVVREQWPGVPVVIVTGTGTEEVAVEAMKRGAADYVLKKIEHIRRLPLTLRSVLDRERALRERQQYRESLRRSEREKDAILNSIPDIAWLKDRDGRFLAVNRPFARKAGVEANELAGKTDLDIWSPELADRYRADDEAVMAAGRMKRVEEPLVDATGRRFWIETIKVPYRDEAGQVIGTAGIARDVTDRREAEEELRRLNRTLRVLSLCNETLVRARDETALLQGICDILVEKGDYLLAWVGYARQDEDKTIEPITHAGDERGYLNSLSLTWADNTESGQGVSATAIRTREAVVVRIVRTETRFAYLRAMAEAIGIASAIALPLLANGETIGTLTIYSCEEGLFDQEEVKLLKELAEDLAYGITALRERTAREQAEEALRLRQRAVEASSNGIMIGDAGQPDWPILYVNSAFERITGYAADEVAGNGLLFLAGKDQGQKGLVDLREALLRGFEAEAEIRNYCRHGDLFWSEMSVAPVRDEAGQVTHTVGILTDITDRKRYEEQLEHQANYDSLTGLANRNLLNDRLNQGMAYAQRWRRQMAALLLDLDRFKVINDSLGHSQGDELLREVGRRLAGCVRSEDTVARMGGDEFVVVLQGLERQDDAARLALKIHEALSPPHLVAGHEIVVGASIGISLYPRDCGDAESLIRNADMAMYRSKEEGGGRLHFFSPEMDAQTLTTMEMEADLRLALERNELLLHYQPKVDIASGRIVGCEALLRWRHPQRGMVSPGQFIPLAEATSLIEPIGEWVLREACRQARGWLEKGLPALSVAVNLSARQFRQKNLPATVSEALKEAVLDPAFLDLELTESAIMHQPEEATDMMHQLKALGVRLSLDDFGTGYSSFNYLRRFPVDNLKIDRSFIADVLTDPSAASVADSIVTIAHRLGLMVIAEGVEEAAQLEFLHRCGCDAYQGYLFSKPLPAEEFEALLRKKEGARGRP